MNMMGLALVIGIIIVVTVIMGLIARFEDRRKHSH